MSIKFDERVAIVTGAGAGIGRAHALALSARGARVVVNDIARADGTSPADDVVAEIVAAGGQAIASRADVTDAAAVDAMAAAALDTWGRIDILINNAGILRDTSFAKMTAQDFQRVLDVHLVGAFNCCKAVWQPMLDAEYGRILMTTSSTGLFGNFGQANYGAAKLGMVGLMNSLQIEGGRKNIHVNAISPAAATQMTEKVFPGPVAALVSVDDVTPAALFLVSDQAPRRAIISAAAGCYSRVAIVGTKATYLEADKRTPEAFAEVFASLSDVSGGREYAQSADEVGAAVMKAAKANGIELPM